MKDIVEFKRWVAVRWGPKKLFGNKALAIMTLGLCGEAGEVSEPIKKELRGDGPVDIEKLTLELGDVLHYLVCIAIHYHISVVDIMEKNMVKLEARDKRKKAK